MRDYVGAIALALVITFIFVAGVMGITHWYNAVQAENDKKQCIESGFTPVPWYGRYYCKTW